MLYSVLYFPLKCRFVPDRCRCERLQRSLQTFALSGSADRLICRDSAFHRPLFVVLGMLYFRYSCLFWKRCNPSSDIQYTGEAGQAQGCRVSTSPFPNVLGTPDPHRRVPVLAHLSPEGADGCHPVPSNQRGRSQFLIKS